jgi:pimeloyl-ACP methyl ester carboxylesterase
MILHKKSLFAALAASFLMTAAAGAQERPAGWTDGYVMANGVRIHYLRTGGEKPPLVLAHGSSDDALVWTNLARELQDGYDVIMFDARGHGLSDPPSAADPADVQVEDLAGLIRELKLEKPLLMGHSMGSASVAHFAARYPDVPRAVILEDPGLGQPTGGAATTPGAAAPQASVDQRRAAILARNNMTHEALVADCMRNSPTWGRSECEAWAPSKRRHHPLTVRDTPGARPPMSELFEQIAAPTLILKADAQGELRRHNEAVAGLLKNGSIVHISGAGHNVRREGKQQTIEVLRAFLGGV